jgi:hypothetical protein
MYLSPYHTKTRTGLVLGLLMDLGVKNIDWTRDVKQYLVCTYFAVKIYAYHIYPVM